MTQTPPLDSIRVIDFSRYIAGPFCASVLGDLGADVIRVEPVDGGEDRQLAPIIDDADGALFMQMNRNKRSLAVDMKMPVGREIVDRLVQTADVVVTNMPLQTLEHHRLDRRSLLRLKPDLITVNISAFGIRGRLRDRTGFDPIGQGLSGAAYLSGNPNAPSRAASPYVDYGTGLAGALGVLAALIQRMHTGVGQDVQASLLATAMTFINIAHIEEAVLGIGRPPYGNRSPYSGPSDFFQTKDGTIAVQVVGERMFGRWCRLVGRPELVDDERFKGDAMRGRNGEALSRIMAEWTSSRTTSEAVHFLSQNGIPAGPIYSPQQTLMDELVGQTGILESVAHPALAKPVPLAGLLIRLGAQDRTIRTRAPLIGEHTTEILTGLGISKEKIIELIGNRIIAVPKAGGCPPNAASPNMDAG